MMIQFVSEPHDEIKAKVDSGAAALLDVREQEEWDQTHLAEAFLVPLSELAELSTRDAALAKIPKDKPVYCHCYRGVRAMQCAQFLNQLGFDIHPMGDDYEALAASVFDEVAPRG